MEEKIMARTAERAWKHRFAQTLWKFLYLGGAPRAAALDDAYAHADTQYPIRGVESPEDEALSALSGIAAGQTPANTSDNDVILLKPHNRVRHVDNAQARVPD